MRPAGAALLAALTLAGPAFAADPPDMVAAAKRYAEAAPNTLGIPRLGAVQIANYPEAQFRGVRANYHRFELVNDRIVFCGEVNVKDAKSGVYGGWTKFAYLPGDPPILVTRVPAFGLREVGPQVLRNVCETGKEDWLAPDFSATFQRPPARPAD